MGLLQKYFWQQAFLPLIICLAALSGLALLTQSLSTIDLIVENRQSASTFFYITLLALPQLIAIILPLSVFIAALYSLNKLNIDSEITVAKSVGLQPWKIASPMIRVSVWAMMAHLIINLAIQPLAFREMRSELLNVRTDLASQLLKPGEFISPLRNLTVFARSITPQGELEDVMIKDARDPDAVRTFLAKTGRIQKSEQKSWLVLEDGIIQEIDIEGNLLPVSYERYTLDLTDNLTLSAGLRLKTSDRFLHELLYPDPRIYADRRYQNALKAEGHARLATPLFNIALAFLATAFLVRGDHQKLGYSKRIGVCAAIGFTLRLFGFAVTAAAENNSAMNIYQYLLPLSICFICAFYLLNPKRLRLRLPRRGPKHRVITFDAVS